MHRQRKAKKQVSKPHSGHSTRPSDALLYPSKCKTTPKPPITRKRTQANIDKERRAKDELRRLGMGVGGTDTTISGKFGKIVAFFDETQIS